MGLVLKGGKVFSEKGLIEADILIQNGKIAQIGNNLSSDNTEDVTGKIILPGLIDVHVHFREPGGEHKEDYLSGSKAAAAGGVTTIFDMPNTNPPITTQADVENKKMLAQKSLVNYGFYVGATPENIDSLNDIKDVVGVKVYMGSSTGNLLVDKISDLVRLIEQTNKLVVVHSENEDLIKYFSKKYGHTKMHHQMRDNLAAAISTSSSVISANYFKKRLHVAHMTTKEEIQLLKHYKSPNISCEVCPHHLLLTSEFFKEKGNWGKMNPPLRSEEDRQALWQGIREGIVDLISTDHAPHTMNEKQSEFEKSPCGVPGVQTTLPLMLNEVNNNNLKLEDVVRLCCTNPAKIFAIKQRGEIKEGNYADLVVVDMEKTGHITNESQYSKCGWTPFHGKQIKGWPTMTIVNGNIVFKDNKFTEDKKGQRVEIANE